tara:strand:+ start:3425 stop:3922 length:498 start_codon:yes stop_codon:yes gene_type:complete
MKYKGFQEWASGNSQEKKIKEKVIAKKKVSEALGDDPIVVQIMDQILIHLAKKFGKYAKVFKSVTGEGARTHEYISNDITGFGILSNVVNSANLITYLNPEIHQGKFYQVPITLTHVHGEEKHSSELGNYYISVTEPGIVYFKKKQGNIEDYNFKISIDNTQIVK